MSARDIMPWNGPSGQYPRVLHFRLNASETFAEGEPVAVNADGELTESASTGPVPADLMGIALAGPAASRNPATGNAWATGDMVPVAVPDSNTLFITSNYTEGTAFDDAQPTAAVLGDQAGLVRLSDVWGIDNGQDANEGVAQIVDVLNSQKESIQVTGETLASGSQYYIVFRIVAHQGTPDSAEAPAPSA